MRASRLISILMLLQVRERVTAEELSREFGVSVRTVYRDIDELAASGVPIRGDSGPGGGFQLLHGYRTRLTGLDADEAQAMFMVGLPGPAAALGFGPAAGRAWNKLLAALPESWSESAGRWGERFHLDPAEWYRSADRVVHLPLIARAVLDERVLSMTYQSWTSTKRRQVEPLGMVLKGGSWYFVGRHGQATRIYKVASVVEVTQLEQKFRRPDDFDLSRFWNEELVRFERRLRPEIATLRASPTGLKRLAQLGTFAAMAVEAAGPEDQDGWRTVRLPIENTEHGALMLLGIGPEVRVMEPIAVRKRLGVLAAEIVAMHRR